jgi:hypothetical protein
MSAPDCSSFGLDLSPVPDLPGWFRSQDANAWQKTMNDDWEEAKELAALLRASPMAKGHGVLVGMRGEDFGHFIYVTPPVSARELVESFGVGQEDGELLVVRTAERLAAIERICPLVVTFADCKGLHAEFTRRLDRNAAARIEALWTLETAIPEGLDGYISSGWIGEGPIMLARLVEEQAIRIWWD